MLQKMDFSPKFFMRPFYVCLCLLTACFSIAPLASASETFFPIGMFSVPLDGLKTVKESGFNTAHTYYSDPKILKEFVEKGEELGLKLLIFPGERAEKGIVDFNMTRDFVEAVRKTTSILAWYIADEPELAGGTPSQIKSIHTFLKNMDPKRLTAVVIHRMDRYGQYSNASDILMIDRYPVPRKPLTHIAEATKWAVKQKGKNGPVWSVLQAFGYQDAYYHGWGAVEPTYDEMRVMTFLSIIYGAKGIFYFTFRGSRYHILKSSEHWKSLKKIVAELNRIYPLLSLPNWNINVAVQIQKGQDYEENIPFPIHLSCRMLKSKVESLKAGKYFIAVNSSIDSIEAKFSLTKAPGMVEVLGEERKPVLKETAFYDVFKPYEVHIYRIDSE